MGISRYFDRVAIALSAVCIVHCLALPIVVVLLPALAVAFGGNAHFHALMLWLVVPTSVAGFTLGYRLHGRSAIVALGIVGMLTLAMASVWGHGRWEESVEVGVTVLGSLLLGVAHWRNFQGVRRVHKHA